MDLIILTGMSGAGKSSAMMALEDSGFFCVDNVPPQLIEKFVELHLSAQKYVEQMALIVDSRSFSDSDDFYNIIKKVKASADCELVFLDASDTVILNRYKENRRSHPLVREGSYGIEEAIDKEREILEPVRNMADYLIDTTFTNTKELKETITKITNTDQSGKMLIQFMSFGFKFGMPMDSDLVFDVRCLDNPFYIEDLKEKTGVEKEVQDFVMQSPNSMELFDKLVDLFEFLLPLYEKEGKTRLVIAFGCTGGKHRSVTFAEKMNEYFSKKSLNSIVIHRDKMRRDY